MATTRVMSSAGHGPEEAWQTKDIRRVVDTIPTLAWSARSDGSADFFNRRWLDYSGLSVEQAADWGWTVAVHPDELNGLMDYWRSVLAASEPGEIEARLRRFDGEYRWFLFRATPSFDNDGMVIKWFGTSTDIEDRKRTEAALRQSEERFRLIVDSIPGFVCTLSASGEVELLNRQLLEYFGKTTEELVNWDSTDAVHPDDLPRVIDAWRRSVETGQPYAIELRQRRADGVYRWFQSRALPARDSEGHVTGWYMLLTDIDDRKRAEDAVRSNEQNLRLIVDSIPGFVSTSNAAGQVEHVNSQVLKYFGKTTEELMDWATSDFVHSADLPRLIDAWRRAIETGQSFDLEHRSRGVDGVYRWCHLRARPQRDGEGRVVRWYSLVTDIDKRKRAEEALRESERELRQLVDSVPGMIAVADSNGRSEYVNKRALDYLDTNADGFRDQPMHTVHPDDQESLRNVWLRSNATGQPMDFVHRVRRFDGVYRWVHVRGEPLLDERGRIVRWYYVFTDIDDQRKAEEALRQSERHLRLIVETIPALVSRSRPDGALDYVDRRVVDYTGREMEQIDLDVIHPDDQVSHVQKWHHAMASGEPWDDTYRIRRADGEYRWFYDRVEPLRDPDGRVVSWYAVKIDINDSREMEEALRSTRRKLSTATQIATVAELSASIAHEINQPLASVVTNAHAAQTWLSHDPPNLERAQATLERIIRDGHSAAEVVRRIRALFKEAAPVKAALSMNQLVSEVLRVLSDELRDNSIIVAADLEADLPMIEADQVQIQQTLINLVHNATEAMAGVTDRAKSLVLSSRRQEGELLIQVRDHGVGLEDPTLMFEPFFTTKESGMGMGLVICRSIVEAHGGRIWATANDDAGMTFSFTLPLAAEVIFTS